ncbi:glutamate racemase [Ancylobacter sp. 6x-1]|uniref:Glutamate racemase n=1 Tax=Ancylobacter crimeensis TaxID=2579147 RepID=A0ABT0DGI0_9HYPH|nr:glutamate racemase [Ancylobacter crimeensis]MCK0198842.1 glutamate racemase [Ancylobacter crimeensis]
MRTVAFPAAMSDSTRAPTVLVFDSGLGGLSVFRELKRVRPDARYVYAADDAAFPYGRLDEATVLARVLAVMDALIARYRPDAVVIACNTISTVVLPALRARHAIPFVGTVPAVKPACEHSASGLVSVLATPGTVKRDYTQALIREFGHGCAVTLVGSQRLASLAEQAMAGGAVPDADIAAEIVPVFVEAGGRRTDTVVLACTHYPLLLDRLQRLAPWPVRWVDPAPAIARRLGSLLGPAPQRFQPEPLTLVATGTPFDQALVEALAGAPAQANDLLDLAPLVASV